MIGEKITGRGILSQVGLETGIPIGQQSVFLLAFIGFFLFAAIFGKHQAHLCYNFLPKIEVMKLTLGKQTYQELGSKVDLHNLDLVVQL